jgi:hypothetical protein
MKKVLALGLDRLIRQPRDLAIVGSADGGHVLDAELARQKQRGLVSEYGNLVIDGKLITPDFLYAIEMTEAVSNAIEAVLLVDHGFIIPSGWISTPDGRVVKP